MCILSMFRLLFQVSIFNITPISELLSRSQNGGIRFGHLEIKKVFYFFKNKKHIVMALLIATFVYITLLYRGKGLFFYCYYFFTSLKALDRGLL